MAFSDAYIREKVKNEHSNFSDNYLNSKGDGSEAYKRRLYLLENQAPVSVQPTVSTVSRSTSQVYKTSGKTSKEWQDEIDKLTKSRTKLNDEYSYANAYVVGMQRSGTNSKDDIKNATDYANTLKQQLSELDAQIENAKSGKWAVDNESKYSGIEKNSDFKEKSAVERSSVKGWDETYRYINDVDGAKEKRDNTIGGSVLLGENYDKYNYMSQQEIATYNYLYNTQGKKNANEYLDYLTYDLDYRRTQTNVAGWSDDATKKPVATSAASVGSNLVSGVGLVDVAAQNAARNVSGFFGGEYKPINYYGQAMDTTNYTTAVRGTISSNLANEYGTIEINEDEHPLLASIFNGKSIGDVYQLGMSMVDSTATAAIGKLTGIGSSGAVLLGGSAGSQGVLTALENGATDEQALAMGLLNGAFESLFEYVSLDKLLNGNTNGILKNVLEQGFIEGTEEFNTTLFNTIADICVMAEKSDYKRTVNQYVEHGLSQVEAETKAMQDIAIGMGWDFIGGAISGGLMGGSKAALINAYQSSQAKKIYGDNVQSLVDESKEINPDSKLAKTVSEKLESGKKVSGRSIKNLVAENESGMISNDKAAIKKAVATQLEQYGETGDVDAISSAIAKQTAGEKLTSSEQETIRSGKYSQRVLNELNQENYGEYNTEWVEKINTDRVDVNSYSRMLRSSQMAQNAPESVSAEQSQKDTTHAANVQQRETVPQKSGIKATNLTDSVKVKVAPTIEEEAKRYGKQSEAFIHTMIAGQDAEQYATAYRYAFNYAKAGVPLKTIKTLETTSYLTDTQKQIAYDTAMASLNAEETTTSASGKVAIRKKGAVRLDGANYAELNDQQKRATSVVRNIAEATGVNVVLYKGNIAETERTGLKEEGHYSKKENTIYVDITAGIFAEADAKKIGQYTMLRTFTHEFVHFVERENAPEYRTLRELVLARIDENAEKNGGLTSVELIKAKMELYGNRLSGENLEDEASREVVADALADMLPQSSFAQQIYNENQSLFEKIVDKLKQFVADLKSYFDNLTALDKPEARMLKQEINGQIKYAQDIVDAFDKAAKGAAANNQAKNGAKKAADDGGIGDNQFSYAGQRAKTSDSNSLQIAKDMEQNGNGNEEIRKETGWFRGMDGKWRFEIDDSKITINMEAAKDNNYLRLHDLIDAPELFMAYPDMKGMDVVFQSLDKARGQYNRQFDSIDISKSLLDDKDALFETLIHEIQHAIQMREGFSRGTTVESWQRKIDNGFDSRTAQQRRDVEEYQRQYDEIKNSDYTFFKDMEKLDSMAPDVPRGEIIDWNTLESEPDPPEWVSYDAERDSMEEKYGDRIYDFIDLKYHLDRAKKAAGRTATDLYFDTAGEIEARDTSTRRNYTDRMRREKVPNLSDDAVFAEDDGGAQYSVSQRDSEYMDAVERGDTEAAQKMVDDVAKDNGYNILAYHGSRSIFNTFSKNRLGSNTNTESSKKWFFAADKETANSYYPYGAMKYLEEHNPNLFKAGTADNMKQKGKLYNLYLKGENPLVVDVKDYDYASHREKADAWVEYIQEAEKNGNDVIILLNALDNQLKTGARESTVYMFRNPAQVKSADPVTYDDNGKVIPLSERFNSDEEDIRYSLTTNAERDIRQAATAQGYRGDVVLSDTTPQIMTSQRDVKNLPFVMRGDHIRQNILTETEARSMGLNVDEHTHYHGIGADKFIEIMDNLDNVREAYRGTKNASDPIRGTRYFVLVPNVKDSAGNDIVAFVYINEKSEQNSVYIDVNKAATVFGKEGLREYINRELSRKNIVRIKNRGPISSEPRALIAQDYTDVTSSEVAANQAAMATYGSNVAQTSESVNKKDLTDSDQRSLSERPDRMSDTEVLVRAAEAVQAKDAATSKLTSAQKDALSIMLKRAQKLYDEQQRKEKMVATKRRILRGRNVSELNAAEADSLAKVTNNINTVNGIIRRAEAELAQVENSKVIKEVLGTARKMVESDAKKRGNEAADKAVLAEKMFYGRQIHRIKESSKRRELRESIGRTAKSFRQMLLHATDSKYAPVDLMQSCLDVALMLDTSGERDGTKSKVKFNNMMDALRTMKEQYDELAKSDDSDFSTEYDKDFAFMVQQLAKSIGNKPVRELTNAQLQDVHDVLHDINAMLRDARFQIGKADKVTNYSVGDRIIREARSVPVRTKVESAADASFRLTGSVLRNIRRITLYNDDAALAHLFSDLNEGIRKKDTFIMESTQLFERFAGERYVKSSKEVKQYNTGTRKIAMTEMEAMQLVLTWERELSGKTKHLSEGGAVIPVQEWMNRGKYQDAIIKAPTAHRIEQHEIIAIQKTFDGWANDYMDTARKFFNGKAKNAINNTTMQTKHRAIAMSENYIPIEVDKNVIASELEGVKFDATIEGMGMLKSVVNGASSPVVIRGLDQVIESHIERVGQLYGLAIPVRNFNKAFNVKQVDSGMTPRKAIGMAWNADDVNLIEQALTDLQTRRATAQDGVSKTLRKAQGAFVKSTLLSNVSVTIKQAASYSTAGLYLSQKALAPYQGTIAKLFANNESKFAKDLFSEIDEHTATHYMRRKGMSMQEINTIAQDTSKIVRKMDEKLPDAANPLKWIQNMDVATTAALWLASKKQVELDGGKQTDADYWNKVTELYDKVIEETQPMYDTLHRPEIQKTTNELVRSIVMFRTQPLQNAGILYDAASELAAAKKYGDDATIKSATKKLRNAAVSQLASLAVFATMSFLAYAVRNRLGRYKDDEDELTVMSIIGRILGDMGNNAAQLALPIGGGELAGLIEKSVTGSRYGGEFSVPVVDMANDFISATSKVWEDIAEFEDGGNENLLEDVKELSMQTAGFFSIPAKNVHNIFVGIIGNVTDLAGTPISWATDIPDPNMKAAYAAFDNGHFYAAKEKIKGVIDSKVEAGKTSKEAKSAVKSSMTSHWKPLYLKAYKNKDNEEMKRIRKIMHASGVYGGANNVVESCQSWVKKANEK